MDYLKLYNLQDKVLNEVFSITKSFYLTGGTALHRFYYDIRYSDDLDFFCIDEYYSYEIREIINNLKENIFVNKITAIMGRDEAKDIGDFYFLKQKENYNLKEYLQMAKEKMIFETEDFLFRLNTFPLEKINNVNFKKRDYLDEILNNYKSFVENIKKEIL